MCHFESVHSMCQIQNFVEGKDVRICVVMEDIISHQMGDCTNPRRLVPKLGALYLLIVDDVDGGQLRKDIPEIISGKSGQ